MKSDIVKKIKIKDTNKLTSRSSELVNDITLLCDKKDIDEKLKDTFQGIVKDLETLKEILQKK